MPKQLSERELIELQIQAYEFYAGLLDRAVASGAHGVTMPRWDVQRGLEYRQLAEQLRARLAELEAEDPAAAAATPGVVPIPTSAEPMFPQADSATVGGTTATG